MKKSNLKKIILLGSFFLVVSGCASKNNPSDNGKTGNQGEGKLPERKPGKDSTKDSETKLEINEFFEGFRDELGNSLVDANPKSTLSNVKSFCQDSQLILNQNKKEIKKLQAVKNDYEIKLQKLTTEYAEAQQLLSKPNIVAQDLKQNEKFLEDNPTKIESLENKINENNTKITSLEEELKKERNKVLDMTTKIKEAEEAFKKQVKEDEEIISNLRGEVTEIKKTIEANNIESENFNNKKLEAEKNLERVTLELNSSKKEIETFKNENSEYKQKIIFLMNDQEKALEILRKEIDEKTKELNDEKTKTLENLNVDEETKKQISEKENEIVKLKTEMNEQKVFHDQKIADQEIELQKSTTKINSLNETVTKLTAEKEENENEIKQLNETVNQLTAEKAENENKIKQLNEDYNILDTNFKNYTNNAVQEHNRMNSDFKDFKTENNKEIENLSKELEEAHDQHSRAVKLLEQKIQENKESYDASIGSKNVEIIGNKNKINTLEAELFSLKQASKIISKDKDKLVKKNTELEKSLAALEYENTLNKEALSSMMQASYNERKVKLGNKEEQTERQIEDIKKKRTDLENKFGKNADYTKIENAEKCKIYWHINQEKGKGEKNNKVENILQEAKEGANNILLSDFDKNIKLDNCTVTFNGEEKKCKKKGHSEIFKKFFEDQKVEAKTEEKLKNILYLLTEGGILKNQQKILQENFKNENFPVMLLDDKSREIALKIDEEKKIELTCKNNYSLGNTRGIIIECTSVYKEGNENIETGFELKLEVEVNLNNFESIEESKKKLLDDINNPGEIKDKGKFIYDLCTFLNIGLAQFIKNKIYPIVYNHDSENVFSDAIGNGTLEQDVNTASILLNLFHLHNYKTINLTNTYWEELQTYINTLKKDESVLVPLRIEVNNKERYALMYIGPDFKVDKMDGSQDLFIKEEEEESFSDLNINEEKENELFNAEISIIKSDNSRCIKFIGLAIDEKETSNVLFGNNSKISLNDLTKGVAETIEYIKTNEKTSFIDMVYIMTQLLSGKMEREFLQDSLDEMNENMNKKIINAVNEQYNILDAKHREILDKNGDLIEFQESEIKEVPDTDFTKITNKAQLISLFKYIKDQGEITSEKDFKGITEQNEIAYKKKEEKNIDKDILFKQINADIIRAFKFTIVDGEKREEKKDAEELFESLNEKIKNPQETLKAMCNLQQGAFVDLQEEIYKYFKLEKENYNLLLIAQFSGIESAKNSGLETNETKFEISLEENGIKKIELSSYFGLHAMRNPMMRESGVAHGAIQAKLTLDYKNKKSETSWKMNQINDEDTFDEKKLKAELLECIGNTSTQSAYFIYQFISITNYMTVIENNRPHILFNSDIFPFQGVCHGQSTVNDGLNNFFTFLSGDIVSITTLKKKYSDETLNLACSAFEIDAEDENAGEDNIMVEKDGENKENIYAKYIKEVEDVTRNEFKSKIVIPIALTSQKICKLDLPCSVSHSCAIVVDKENKILYLYDPKGVSSETNRRLIGNDIPEVYLTRKANDLGYTYKKINLNNQGMFDTNCVLWTAWFVYLVAVEKLEIDRIERDYKDNNAKNLQFFLSSKVNSNDHTEEFQIL